MNNFKVKVKQWNNCGQATAGVNQFISECNAKGILILDITSHVTEIEDFMTYVFVFKMQE